MIFQPFFYPATGCASYLVGCGGKGVCAVIDPKVEDVDAYAAAAASNGMRIAYVIDTHIQADHRSGGRLLAERTGASYALHGSAAVSFPFEPLADGQVLELGNVVARVMHTPGHTPESICIVVTDHRRGEEPWLALTGDTMFSGAVGRPDLPGHVKSSAAALYESLRRLLALPDTVEVYPAHFSGSACGAGMSGKPMSTIGFERRWNPLLALTRDDFVRQVSDAIPAKPAEMLAVLRFNQGLDVISPTTGSPVSLGLRANAGQFALLVLVNAFVGAMVGQERSILPAIAEHDFDLAARSAILSFIVVFGVVKAATNYLAGYFSDRVGRKRVLLIGWAVAAPVPFLLMWAPSWGWVLVANAFLGVSQGLTWSTTVIMKIDLAGPARRGLAMGLNEFAGYFAVAASALATGYVAHTWGLRPEPFYLGVAYVVLGGGVALLLVRETHGHARAEATATRAAPPLAAAEVFRRTTITDRDLSSVSQAGLVNNLNDGMAWGLFPLVFALAKLDVAEIAALAAIYPAVWGVVQLVTGAWSDRIGRKRLIAGGMWLQAAAICGVAMSGSFAGFAVAQALLGVGTAMVYPTLLAAIGDVAHPSWRASAVGVYRLWRDLGYAVGALLAGFTADAVGLSGAVWAVAAITAGSGLVVSLRMRETLNSRSSRDPHHR